MGSVRRIIVMGAAATGIDLGEATVVAPPVDVMLTGVIGLSRTVLVVLLLRLNTRGEVLPRRKTEPKLESRPQRPNLMRTQ